MISIRSSMMLPAYFCLVALLTICRSGALAEETTGNHDKERGEGMIIRRAADGDVEAMADLAEKKAIQYEKYQPVFHRRADGARKMRLPYLKSLLAKENVIVLVAGDPGAVEGFICANIVNAPPVYNPGGKVLMVDDFMVSKPEFWPTLGKALLEHMSLEAEKSGAVLGNVVCGPLDGPKRSMLQSLGYSVASEWFVKPLK